MAKSDSIIEVIQKMVQEGQPREKILATLKDLGVTDDQGKKLLLIAEADTLTLLKRELKSIVHDELLDQKDLLDEQIKHGLDLIEQEEKIKAGEIARSELKDVREGIMGETKDFEDRINKVIADSQKAVSLVKVALDSLNSRMAQLELDTEQMKVHKYRKKSMFFSYAMLAFGVVLLLVAVYLLLSNFAKLDISQIIVLVVFMLASIVLMFASIVS